MRGQTIQLEAAQDATPFLVTLDDDVSIDMLGWGGQTTRIRLVPDHAAQPHLLEAGRVVRVMVEATDDVEAHTLTFHFPTPAEAARFRTKVLAGTLLIGAIAVPAAIAASSGVVGFETGSAPAVVPVAAPVAAPVTIPAADPSVPASVRFQADREAAEAPNARPGFVLQSGGTSEATGEESRSGSSIQWVNLSNDEAK